MAIDLKGLKVEIPYKYKPQSMKYGKAIMVGYIDARDAQDLLDDVVGPENWQTDYSVINGNLYCRLGIKCDEEWVWKSDCGTESNQEKEKGESSDAFKRAAVQWGIGRFLYRLGVVELGVKKHTNGKEYPATKDGKILWNADQVTEYIMKTKGKSTAIPASKPKPTGKPASKPSSKYQKPSEPPTYTAVQYSDEVIKKVTELEVDGVKGKACLLKHLEAYNKENKSDYKKISDLNTDELLLGLIGFITNMEPKGI